MKELLFGAMHDMADAWLVWMLPMAWQITVLVLVLALLTWALRHRSARLRYGLWLLVPIRLVLPPTLAFATGWGWWVLPANETASVKITSVESARNQELDASTAIPIRQENMRSDAEVLPLPTQRAERLESPRPVGQNDSSPRVDMETPAVASPTLISASGVTNWRTWLFGGWICVVGILSLRLAAGRIWATRLVRGARPPHDGRLVEVAEHCRRYLGLRKSVRIRESSDVTVPMLIGVYRPTILVPVHLSRQLRRGELEAVFFHELHHVARRDALVSVLQALVGILYFFHPLVWLANRMLNRLREDACDEATVAALAGRRREYGAGIVKIAELVSGVRRPSAALTAVDSADQVKRRLARILDPALPAGRRISWSALLLLAIVAAVLLPAAARPQGNGEESEAESAQATSDKAEEIGQAQGMLEVGSLEVPDPFPPVEPKPVEMDGWHQVSHTGYWDGWFRPHGRTQYGSYEISHLRESDGSAAVVLRHTIERADLRHTIEGADYRVRLDNGQGEWRVGETVWKNVNDGVTEEFVVFKGVPLVAPSFVALDLRPTAVPNLGPPRQLHGQELEFPHWSPDWSVPADAEFGPVIKRVVGVNNARRGPANRTDYLVDLDDGDVSEVPANLGRQRRVMQLRHGFDIRLDPIGGFANYNIAVLEPAPKGAWDRFTPQKLAEELAQAELDTGSRVVDSFSLPAEFLYKTREGGIGMLRVEQSPQESGFRTLLIKPVDRHGSDDEVGAEANTDASDADSSSGATDGAFAADESEADPVRFPGAQTSRSSPTRSDRSVIWFRSDEHVHFVLYHDGFLQTGLSYTKYDHSSPNHPPQLWKFRGTINALSGERTFIDGENQWEHERQFSFEFNHVPPRLSLELDGQPYDLSIGRVFVLPRQGAPIQLDVAPPAVDERDDEQALNRFESEVESAAAKPRRPEDEVLRFSETKQVVLSMDSTKYMLDLDTGKTMDPPARTGRPEQKQMDVHATQMQPYQHPTGLTGLSLRGLKVNSGDWTISAWDVHRALHSDEVQPLARMDYAPGEPTYIFRTRDGKGGILQLRELVDDPKGIRIRYKTVEAPAALSPATEGGRGETDEPIPAENKPVDEQESSRSSTRATRPDFRTGWGERLIRGNPAPHAEWSAADRALREAMNTDPTYTTGTGEGLTQDTAIAAWRRFLERDDLTRQQRAFASWRIGSLYAYNFDASRGESADYQEAEQALARARELFGGLVTTESLNSATVWAGIPGSEKERAKRLATAFNWLFTRSDEDIDRSAHLVHPRGGILDKKFHPSIAHGGSTVAQRIVTLRDQLIEHQAVITKAVAENIQYFQDPKATAALLKSIEDHADPEQIEQWRRMYGQQNDGADEAFTIKGVSDSRVDVAVHSASAKSLALYIGERKWGSEVVAEGENLVAKLEASDQIRLDGDDFGHGIIFSSRGGKQFLAISEDGQIPFGQVVIRQTDAIGRTADAIVVADIVATDDSRIPVSLRLE